MLTEDQTTQTPRPPLLFHCDADAGTLLLLYLKTFLLSVVTLGVYSFWGRTEIRRYLYSSVRAGEDRFQYHGTAVELLKGWLKAAALVIVMYTLFFALTLSNPRWGSTMGTVFFYVAILAVLPLVIVGTYRYRLSRTSLRGIRFGSRATVGEFARIYYPGLLLMIVTLGFYGPWFHMKVTGYLTRTTHYGDQSFSFDGDGKDLFGRYVAFVLLLIPTLYLIAFSYAAAQSRYVWSRTGFRDSRFESTMRGRELLWLAFSNLLIIVCTLGIGFAWVSLRSLRYTCQAIRLDNFAGFGEIQQSAMAASATGEGVAAILDVDSGFGDFGT